MQGIVAPIDESSSCAANPPADESTDDARTNSSSDADASSSGRQEMAWLLCISGSPACAWNASGKRIRASEPLDVAPPAKIHYGGCPGDAGYRRLAAAELEDLLGFELICNTIVMSPRDHRELPLHNLPEDALGQDFVPPLGAPSAALLCQAIRRCESHEDLFVAPDEYGGHGLFAAGHLPSHAYLGEYVGTLVSSVPHARAANSEATVDN
jgi:hypothetical protein